MLQPPKTKSGCNVQQIQFVPQMLQRDYAAGPKSAPTLVRAEAAVKSLINPRWAPVLTQHVGEAPD
ncbi:hypothetical protein EYF80_011033 [Liparis tanakae]|uniref:Uncharacterized protein n=1 Tax=Liparis tanakae TaxID=230148 RepID=A0A4Z2INV5_9TELE|nr:hypothetical protein EYF80_011033 [Liparis tanakae]